MIRFENLKPAQLPAITQMMADFYAIDHYPFDPAVSEKLFDEFIADEKLGRAWLIFENNETVGYTIMTFVFSFEYGGRIAFIDELYLTKDARGKGIGKKTIHFLKEQAVLLNVKLLYLEMENHNENAQKLYLASDFIIHNRKLLKFKL